MDGKSIATLESVRDLGVLIRQDLSWDGHYKAKAYKILGLIRRSFSVSCSEEGYTYISLVRSQILYCSQVWRPSLIKHINTLERIQRKATKLFSMTFIHRTCFVWKY